MIKIAIVGQIIIAVSIFIVWVIRFKNVEKEFKQYKLPVFVRSLIGATKVSLSTLIVVGIWYPQFVFIPCLIMAFLMASAQFFHFKAKHTLSKYIPSFCLMMLSLFVAAAYYYQFTPRRF